MEPTTDQRDVLLHSPLKKPKKKRTKPASSIESTPHAAPNNAFNRPLLLSPELAELVGTSHLSRPQVVKKIWEHVHAHSLQDPADKRQIICNEAMRRVFKVNNVHIFTMNKVCYSLCYLLSHV